MAGMMAVLRRFAPLFLVPWIAAWGTPPKPDETVWATVAEIYTQEKLLQSWNKRRVAARDPGDDHRLGWNAVTGSVEQFRYRGSLTAYRFMPDWKERGLSNNLAPVGLEPGQTGRYVIVHSSDLIKCRQNE